MVVVVYIHYSPSCVEKKLSLGSMWGRCRVKWGRCRVDVGSIGGRCVCGWKNIKNKREGGGGGEKIMKLWRRRQIKIEEEKKNEEEVGKD